MANAVRWAAGPNRPPIRVEAPLCVQAGFYTQNHGQRTIVHLLNEVNTTANRALPENNPSEREETLPIVDIKIVNADARCTHAFLEPDHRPLPITRTGPEAKVTVPRLEVHAMVVFE